MTRVKDDDQHQGVTVFGRQLYADGRPDPTSFEIVPGRSMVVNGVMYSSRAVKVQPDAEGRFSVVLPPSSLLGAYTVQLSNLAIHLIVPDDVTSVRFEDIVQQ